MRNPAAHEEPTCSPRGEREGPLTVPNLLPHPSVPPGSRPPHTLPGYLPHVQNSRRTPLPSPHASKALGGKRLAEVSPSTPGPTKAPGARDCLMPLCSPTACCPAAPCPPKQRATIPPPPTPHDHKNGLRLAKGSPQRRPARHSAPQAPPPSARGRPAPIAPLPPAAPGQPRQPCQLTRPSLHWLAGPLVTLSASRPSWPLAPAPAKGSTGSGTGTPAKKRHRNPRGKG